MKSQTGPDIPSSTTGPDRLAARPAPRSARRRLRPTAQVPYDCRLFLGIARSHGVATRHTGKLPEEAALRRQDPGGT